MSRVNNKVVLLKEEFAVYANKDNLIDVDGFMKMGKALGIDISADIFMIYFCFKCEGQSYGQLNLEEFSKGMSKMNVKKFVELKHSINKVKEDLLVITNEEFRKFYYYIFEYSMDKSKKVLDFEIVKFFWCKLFSIHFKIMDELISFYENHFKSEPLKQDPWNCLLDFLIKIGDKFPKGYRIIDSWPIIFDEFFKYYIKKYNIEIDEDDEFA